jgi:hypothetical protein
MVDVRQFGHITLEENIRVAIEDYLRNKEKAENCDFILCMPADYKSMGANRCVPGRLAISG